MSDQDVKPRRQIEVVWNGESHSYTLAPDDDRPDAEIVDDFLQNADVFNPR